MPDERRAFVAEQDEQVAEASGERPERVIASTGRRGAVARKIGRDTVWCRASGSITSCQFPMLPAIPWISSSTGPLPASTQFTARPWSSTLLDFIAFMPTPRR